MIAQTEPQITTLANGLRVATDTMTETETVSISIWVNVGSRHETLEQNGLSHFLEHMAFKGTKRRSAQQIAEEFDDIGGHLNAGTSREHTVYYAKILKENTGLAMDILGDILQNSTFDSEELEKERGVILQEIAMTHDTPDDIIFDHFLQTAYPDQPVGRSILGTTKTVQSFTSDDMHNYVAEHYGPEHMVIAVAGNITHDAVLDLVNQHFRNLDQKPAAKLVAANYNGGVYTEERELEQVHWLLGFEGLSYHDDPDIYTLKMLSNILGGGMSSRLFQEVREKRGLAYSVSCFNNTYADDGMFNLYAGTAAEHMDELVEVVCNELKKVAQNVSQAELDRSRAQARSHLLMAIESSSARADDLGRSLMVFNRYIPVNETLAKLEAITTDGISEMMQRVLSDAKPTMAAIGATQNLPSLADIKTQCAL